MRCCRRALPVPMQSGRRAPSPNIVKKGEFHEKIKVGNNVGKSEGVAVEGKDRFLYPPLLLGEFGIKPRF